MYSSPIDIIYQDIQNCFEEGIYSAIERVNIKVKKDELLRALAYDRHQYEKGYADALADRTKARWVEDSYSGLPCVCSNCGAEGSPNWSFCPKCGAEMKK